MPLVGVPEGIIKFLRLLRHHLVDGRQQRAGLSDVAITQLDGDYPCVTQMSEMVEEGKPLRHAGL